MIINHNMNALNAHRNMTSNTSQAGKSMEKLSSGLRINRAGDDAAGLAISEKMRGQIRGLDQATRNSQDGISLIQTAEGALTETHSILQRMRELSVQSSNDTNVDTDRTAIQDEMNQLTSEIDRIANNTEFNTQNLLDGSFSGKFQIGANGGQSMDLSIGKLDSASLGLTSGITIESGSVAAASTLKDGSYKVSGSIVVDAKGNNVGSISGKSIVVGGAAVASTSLDKIESGSYINISGNGSKFSVDGAITGDAKKLAAGNYETKGSNIVRDNQIVGKLSGNVMLIDDKTATGGVIKISASQLGVSTSAMTSGKSFTINGVNAGTRDQASGSIGALDNAINKVSSERSKLGAVQNRLEHTINNLGTSSENLTAAESRVRDVDMAKEMMNFSKNNILQQAAQAMLAQANQQPQNVLSLLR
ncbi:flagellin N-terminal helical domain-containing protein [Clostridium butyricum]|jgi:flagellin|uniref:flagellin N-terminal helical domain-containing protein n=1 Tax=Clostridium butyricum TaxID=1492 RepID=UPI001AA1A052|nr:flagellin [Clostridium butyricum]MBO1685807.1 flagellin [Clostridium butyricum]